MKSAAKAGGRRGAVGVMRRSWRASMAALSGPRVVGVALSSRSEAGSSPAASHPY